MERSSKDNGVPPSTFGHEHIVVRPGYCGGKPHIAGHRIKVQHVALWHERQGKSPDEIAAEHPGLTLADVHAALTYYYDHREEIDADIRGDEEYATGLKAVSGLSLLLRHLMAGNGQNHPLSP